MTGKSAVAEKGIDAAPAGSWRHGLFALLVAGFAVAGCDAIPTDYFDPDTEATREDFKEAFAARPAEAAAPAPPIPELQSIISTPALGPEIESRRVTVTVTETTPIKDVLIELAREARVDFELDPRIEGGIIFSAYERPFEQVVRRIADLAGLRLKMRDGVLRIEIDEPYHVNYKIGYLNMVRSATSEVATESSVVGGDEDGTGSSGGGGASSSLVSSESEADFWAELEANITQILTNTGRFTGLVAPPAPEPVIVAPAATAPGAPAVPAAAAPPAVPAPAAQPSGAAIPRLTPAFTEASSAFTVNRQAGILSVFGSERQHSAIEAYLLRLRTSVSAQVLIEAKILEVSLDDEFRFGIDWVSLFRGGSQFAAPFNIASAALLTAPPFDQLIAPTGGTTATANLFTATIGGEDLNVIARAVEAFGTVRALSSPRLTVMQNQTAVLKVAEERVFFSQEIEPGIIVTDGTSTVPVVTSVINTVTVGLIMTVQPSINLDTDEITLTLRPTITRVVDEVQDPSVEVESLIPELGVQEIDSVVTISSGGVIVMGGLMQDRTTVDEIGVPFLSDIPWIGQAFKSTARVTTKSELVIFLRATIIRGKAVDPYDIELYELFGGDRRPLTF